MGGLLAFMTALTLQQYRLRGTRLVPMRDRDPESLEWTELVKRLAPSASAHALLILRHAKIGEFIGTRTREGKQQSFKVAIPNGEISAIMRRQPSFGSDLLEVYRVERTQWDASMTEPSEEASR